MKKKKTHELRKGCSDSNNTNDYKEDIKLRLYTVIDYCYKTLHLSSIPYIDIKSLDTLPAYRLVDLTLYIDSISEIIHSVKPKDITEREYCILLNHINSISKILQ